MSEHCDDPNCDHDHEHEFETVFITLDDDTEVECTILGTFDVDEREYIALLPLDDEEVLIYSYEESDEGPVLGLIETDEEFEKVTEAFYDSFDLEDDIFEDDFEDEDEDEE